MSRKQGKVVDTWWYTDDGQRIEVPVRVRQRGSRLVFAVDLDSPTVDVEHADTLELRRLAWAAIKKAVAITWREVYIIEVAGSETESHHTGPGMTEELSFGYDHAEVGTNADGTFVHRAPFNRRYPDHHRHVHGGLPRGGENVSMVDATPENKARIQAVIMSMRRLGEMMAELMSPEKVQRTLENVRLLGLPAPGKARAAADDEPDEE